MNHERDDNARDVPYYPIVSKKVAQDLERLWHEQPDLMRTRTRAQIGEFSPSLVQLLDIMEKFGDAAPNLPKGTGSTISDGMMQAFSMLLKQVHADNQHIPELTFNPYDFSDKELPLWGLLESPQRRKRIIMLDITPEFFRQNKEIAQSIVKEAPQKTTPSYFVAGAALVTRLYYEATHR